MLEIPALFSIIFLAIALYRLAKQEGDNLKTVSKKQMALQLAANSLYAIFFPIPVYLGKFTLTYVIFNSIAIATALFGFSVLVKTLCELADLQIVAEANEGLNQMYKTQTSDGSSMQLSQVRSANYSDALQYKPRTNSMNLEESALYEHLLGRSSPSFAEPVNTAIVLQASQVM